MPRIPLWIFILPVLLYFSAARLDIMDIDASQYAEISREMLQRSNWLEIYDRGHDYLDKPPFLFWASALSMKVFGVNNFGYRFPSILFALLALYAVYRLARRLYDEDTGRLAALIFSTCQAMFLWTNDIRTDTILASATIASIWLVYEWTVFRQWKYLLVGCTFIAIGMMTKGPVALLVPVFSFSVHWILRREWKMFLQPSYLVGLLLIGLLLVPMSIGLYQQFDMHPEKVMDGKTGVSGLRFFYWSQSFGRITGESPWNNNAPFSFLFENMLWAFIPWILLFIAALLIQSFGVVKQRFRLLPGQEYITTGGFILTYVSLASSRYQLPHYLFVVYPLAAIMVAALLRDCFQGRYKGFFRIIRPVQTAIAFSLLLAAGFMFLYVFKGEVWIYLAWGAGVIIWFVLALKKMLQPKFFWLCVVSMLVSNIVMTHHFYYELLKYQAGSQIGRYVKAKDLPVERTHVYNMEDPLNSLHFYSERVLTQVHSRDSFAFVPGSWVITGQKGMDTLTQHGYHFRILDDGHFFKVSELTPGFLNPQTRGTTLKHYFVLQMN